MRDDRLEGRRGLMDVRVYYVRESEGQRDVRDLRAEHGVIMLRERSKELERCET